MKKLVICLCLVLFTLATVEAQQKYWIYLKDKITDKDEVVKAFENQTISIHVYSKWLNAFSGVLDQNQQKSIRNHPLVRSVEPIDKHIKVLGEATFDPIRLGKALDQINADTLIHLDLSGNGVKVGIIDAGFMNANKNQYLINLIEKGQVISFKNFIEQDNSDPYVNSDATNDAHGTKVFSFLAGKYDDNYSGLAHGSTFYLARTDQADKEYRGEEDYWIEAVEWMHSQGVRLINSSLGYTNGFDDSKHDYLPEQVNGKYSAITRFTELAIKEKGMTIVISAGNDGNQDFQIISIPADAEGVISVGSSGYRYWNKLGYSSIGPEHLPAVKPEVSCYAAGGTSFAAPVISGLVACLKEFQPEITNDELLDVLTKSSHLYPFPNNYLGYGVPDTRKAIKLLTVDGYKLPEPNVLEAKDSLIISLAKSYNIMAFHKKDHYLVLDQEKLRWQNNEVIVVRPSGAAYTTITNGEKVWEVKWID